MDEFDVGADEHRRPGPSCWSLLIWLVLRAPVERNQPTTTEQTEQARDELYEEEERRRREGTDGL